MGDDLSYDDLTGKRRSWRIAFAVFGVLCALTVIGTIWTRLASDQPWDDGDLDIDLSIVAAFLTLTILAALRARYFGRLATTAPKPTARGPITWLPPASGGDGPELAGHILRLRTISRWVALSSFGWFCALPAAAGLFVLMAQNAQDLLDRGTQVPGVVERIRDTNRGDSWIQVRYRQDQAERAERIYRSSDLAYQPGQIVTVVYDPADPDHVRTLEEHNDNQPLKTFAWFLAVLGAMAFPFSTVLAVRWHKRYLAVRATGWRPARATINQPPRLAAQIDVTFRDGSTLALKGQTGLRPPAKPGRHRNQHIWIGGANQHMVILLRRGTGLRAFPVKAESPREVA